mmetsp:Transcript_36984/g.47558  ORF Transcript_36984/g.47558 Transcript_36984/m.47558 type:complete len:411 (-) Transcript_36984:99-1331(-)
MANFEENDLIIERIEGDDVEFALRWDFFQGMDPVDLDAQAVMFNSTGSVVDAAFYNQLTACDGSVIHSGDNRTGAGEGDDETIRVNFDALPSYIKVIAIVVTAYSGGTFLSVESANVMTRDLTSEGPKLLGDVSVGCKGKNTALILAIIFQDPATGIWRLREVGQATMGKHFQECMEFLRPVVCSVLDPNETGERVLSMEKTFEMTKSDIALIPKDLQQQLVIGLGWTTRDQNLDLDASCIMMDKNFQSSKGWICFFNKKEQPGVVHSGDNLTGQGEGDDERIFVKLDEVPTNICHLAFTVNIYSDGRNFSEVSNSYVRMMGANDHVMAIYKLDGSITSRGLLFAVLSRRNNQWSFKAVGGGIDGGRAYDSECLEDVRALMEGREPQTVSLIESPAQENTADSGGCCSIL